MDHDSEIKKWSNQLERGSWCLIFFALLTQLSTEYSFPSYNCAFGFWGAYCAFGRHGRATFGLIMFLIIAILLDIVVCSINGGDKPIFQFSLAMFILCLFNKIYLLYHAMYFFVSIGGARSMEFDEHQGVNNSAYESLAESNLSGMGGTYYPPDDNVDDIMEANGSSFTDAKGKDSMIEST